MTPTNTSNPRSHRREKTREYKSQRQRVKIFKNRKATEEGISPFVEKYWFQRYCLFSKYDEGIKMDEEGWFSVTPEEIAIRHAERCADGVVIDSFSGVGGNAIQFANKGCHVIAIDVDPEKVALAMNNAKVYGVEEYIDFIVGDFFQLAPSLKGDIVFLSPPWGGPSYKNIQTFTLDLLKPRDGFTMFQVAQAITPNIIMFLPQNTDLNQVEELAWLSSPPLDLEIEANYVHNNLKGVTVYFGGVVAAPPRSVRSRNFGWKQKQEEYLDVLTRSGQKTGISKPRGDVHRDGDYNRVVHVWIFAESTQELLLQRRADCKDSWPGLWHISSAGHISAGDSSLITARRELEEELGVTLPKDAFELIFVFLRECVINDGKYIINEYNDVYLVTTRDPIPLEAFALQETEVSAVKYISYEEYKSLLAKEDPDYVPYDVYGQYGQLFYIIEMRYKENTVARSLSLQKQLSRYAPISLKAELTGLAESDRKALVFLVKAAVVMDEIFYLQAWYSNPVLRDWLKKHADRSELDKLKWSCYLINRGPWSVLDEDKAFLTTADSALRLIPKAATPAKEWKGLEYRAAFPMLKPPGANFYPPDMDKMEFEIWKDSLEKDQQTEATGFFSVIRRHSEFCLDSSLSDNKVGAAHDLYIVPYSQEYKSFLAKAAELLHKAGDITNSPSLKKLLHRKADAFLSNDYYDSDIAWMELDSKLDVTIGPYETYEDEIFGYKASFEAFIGVRDDEATAQLKLFGDNLQVLAQNLPLDSVYKSKDVNAAPIRVIQLIYNGGGVKGPQVGAFSLPNDERAVNEWGTSMVLLKNVIEAKFKHILLPIADVCVAKELQEFVDFESFFTYIICHECCHGIGPHTIIHSNGQKSTVRLKLQEFYSALEEAKADIVGLWALRFLIFQDLLSKNLLKSMYVSFLAGCFRSVCFGLKEAHGKGQALQFNWLYEKGAFVLHADDTFSVDFSKIEGAVESLSRKILTIQAEGDKEAAGSLLHKYGVLTEPLKIALKKLENVQVPVDIAPSFPIAQKILE